MKASALYFAVLMAFTVPAPILGLAAASAEAKRGRVVILASTDMMKNACLTKEGAEHQGNVSFFYNLIDAFALDDRLLGIKAGAVAKGGKAPAISETTRALLGELKDDVYVRYYASAVAPPFVPPLATVRSETLARLKEMADLSGGRLKYEVIAPEEKAREHGLGKLKGYYEALEKGETPAEPEQRQSPDDIRSGRAKAKRSGAEIAAERRKKAEALAEKGKRSADEEFRRLLLDEFTEGYLADLESLGIYAVPVEERQSGLTSQFYTAFEVRCRDRMPEVIPVHHQIETLEYVLMRSILKVTRAAKPTVAFFDGRHPPAPPAPSPGDPGPDSGYSGILSALGEYFDVEKLTLRKNDSIGDLRERIRKEKPDGISVLIIAEPQDLEPRQVHEISRAVSEGIPTIFLVSRYSADLSPGAYPQRFPITLLRPGLDDLFLAWGIMLGKDLLASGQCSSTMVPQKLGGFAFQKPSTMPILLKAGFEEIRRDHPLAIRIPSLVFPAAAGLAIDRKKAKEAGLEVTELVNSGKKSYTVQAAPSGQESKLPAVLDLRDLHDPSARKDGFIDPQPLAVLIEGAFPFNYRDRDVPAWKE